MSQVHAFFDFDDTLLNGDSILFWLRYYYRHRPYRRIFQLLNWVGVILFVLRIIDSHTLKRIFLAPMGLEDPAELDRLASAFVREDLASRFHVPVLQRLWTHHLLGHKIIIISASGTFYLRHLKAFLPMAEILGTEVVWPKRGFHIPKYLDGNLRGENKITRLKAIGYGAAGPLAFAYSDHHHDRFLLTFAEFPICTRPNEKLRHLATLKGWPVMDWADSVVGKASNIGDQSPLSGWKVRLQKLSLLIFAAGTGVPATGSDPLLEAAAARQYAPEHTRALRERVRMRYPNGIPDDVSEKIFGPGRLERKV